MENMTSKFLLYLYSKYRTYKTNSAFSQDSLDLEMENEAVYDLRHPKKKQKNESESSQDEAEYQFKSPSIDEDYVNESQYSD